MEPILGQWEWYIGKWPFSLEHKDFRQRKEKVEPDEKTALFRDSIHLPCRRRNGTLRIGGKDSPFSGNLKVGNENGSAHELQTLCMSRRQQTDSWLTRVPTVPLNARCPIFMASWLPAMEVFQSS